MPRGTSNAETVWELMRLLGRQAQGKGRIYLVGGASAVIVGWRDTTVDVDLKLDPEPPGVFNAIARAKDALNINLELASPDDFIPALPDWRARSVFVARHGPVDFLHDAFRETNVSGERQRPGTVVSWTTRGAGPQATPKAPAVGHFYAQALAKIERGHAQDLSDVEAMWRLKLIESDRLMRLFEAIEADLVRYPAIDPSHFRNRVERAVSASRTGKS